MSETFLSVEQAREFAATLKFGAVHAEVVERGTRDEAREVDGRWGWVAVPNYEVVFTGGRLGEHRLGLAVSSKERIAAHFDGYVYLQTMERPAGILAPAKPVKRLPRRGDKVMFSRGMYGMWKGTVDEVYTGRATARHLGGKLRCLIRFRMANGGYTSARCDAKNLVLVETGNPYDLE
jgi:hypothetical protein